MHASGPLPAQKLGNNEPTLLVVSCASVKSPQPYHLSLSVKWRSELQLIHQLKQRQA